MPKTPAPATLARRARIQQMMMEFRTQDEMAAAEGISQPAISAHIAAIKASWAQATFDLAQERNESYLRYREYERRLYHAEKDRQASLVRQLIVKLLGVDAPERFQQVHDPAAVPGLLDDGVMVIAGRYWWFDEDGGAHELLNYRPAQGNDNDQTASDTETPPAD